MRAMVAIAAALILMGCGNAEIDRLETELAIQKANHEAWKDVACDLDAPTYVGIGSVGDNIKFTEIAHSKRRGMTFYRLGDGRVVRVKEDR